jgi:N-ethylmaleimide reductase
MKTYELFTLKKTSSIDLKPNYGTNDRDVELLLHSLMMGEYYKQRSNAGLIITEGTSPFQMGWLCQNSRYI